MIFLVAAKLPGQPRVRYVVVANSVVNARVFLEKERPLAADIQISILGIEADLRPRLVCAEESGYLES